MSATRLAASLLFVAATAAATSCGSTSLAGPRPAPKVDHLGAISELFAGGTPAHSVPLAPLLGLKHLYALGPLEGLRGEILVWDGTPFTSRVVEGEPRVAVDPAAKAQFLVWSTATEWRDVPVYEDARTLSWFETWLPTAARDAGLDETRPFAFLVVGAVDHATIHVDDFPADGTPLTPETVGASQKVIELADAAVQILGFYAPNEAGAKGVYTSNDSNLHLHLRTQLGTAMGHVDDFALAPGAVLRLPWKR